MNPIRLVMIMDLLIDEQFLFCHMRKYFVLYIDNSAIDEISKCFQTVLHIAIQNSGNNGDIHRGCKYCV